ncbi:unnamed protein product, partial [Closterium sp. NIES-54]
PYLDWFDWDEKWDPLNAQPEPKRRFTPSKHEAKQRKKEWKQKENEGQQQAVYLLWRDDLKAIASHTVPHISWFHPHSTFSHSPCIPPHALPRLLLPIHTHADSAAGAGTEKRHDQDFSAEGEGAEAEGERGAAAGGVPAVGG